MSITSRAPTLQVHETLEGSGTVRDRAQSIADVRYLIKDVEEQFTTLPTNRAPDREVTRARTLCGIVRSAQAAVLAQHLGTRLALELDNGQLLDFAVVKHLDPSTCLIQALGSLR